jgi:release factor glutamine methyltransferase
VGVVTFHGLDLIAAAGLVMTPRPASERLVEAAVAIVGNRPARIADVGTGSGAIAVALAAALPQAEVFATDTSAAAVLLARANVASLQLAERVTVLHGSLLDPVPGALDLVVANLPYLPLAEAGRHPELAGEPRAAVFACADGLDAYRGLVAVSRERLTTDGALVIQLRASVLTAGRDQLHTLAAILGVPSATSANARSAVAA